MIKPTHRRVINQKPLQKVKVEYESSASNLIADRSANDLIIRERQ